MYPESARVYSKGLGTRPFLVTGTNGKTTTVHLLARALSAAGLSTCYNAGGANLMSGITTALLLEPARDTACFEVDEGEFPRAVEELDPGAVAVLNLFRDQLDRYGEVEAVASRVERAIAALPKDTWVILNADDPAVASMSRAAKGPVLTFGIQDETWAGAAVGVQDFPDCRHCGSPLTYSRRFIGHLGHYHCPRCGWSRPHPDLAVRNVKLHGLAGSTLLLSTPAGLCQVHLKILGLAGAYSAAAALALALAGGVPLETARRAIQSAEPAFGRGEEVRLPTDPRRPSSGWRGVALLLGKNPASFAELIRVLSLEPTPVAAVVAVNDRIADGTDISWIWDVDFTALAGKASWLLASGDRAEDVVLRLKYAGLEGVASERSPLAALEKLVREGPAGSTLVFLGTYTAMLELHRGLQKRGLVRPFWKGRH